MQIAGKLCLLAGVLVGAWLGPIGARAESVVNIAQHFGTNSAPFTVIREHKLLEKRVPGLRAEWHKFSSGTDTNEAFLSGSIDVSAMGIAPFITAWSKGVPVRMMSGLVVGPVKLVTYRDDIKTIRDFKPNDRIAVPSPASAQAMMLRMAAKKLMGDAKAMDALMVGLPHPEAMTALLNKTQITAHFATPPFLDQEIAAGMRVVLDSVDAVGEAYSGQIVAATQKFHDKEPQAFAALRDALKEAVEWLNGDPVRAARLLKEADGYKTSVDELAKTISGENRYDHVARGVMPFVTFMAEQGMLRRVPGSLADLTW